MTDSPKRPNAARLWSLLVTLILLVGVLAACSGAPTPGPDPDAPAINITGPSEESVVSQDNVVVTGVLNDNVTAMNYSLNGGQGQDVTFSDNEYAFPITGLLNGKNEITVTVSNADGDTVVVIIIIIFNPDAGGDMADTFYVSNNGPQNAGEVDTFDEDFDQQNTFFSGNNEGVELDRFGDLYHAGDGDNGPSIRIISQFYLREGGSFDPGQDREIKGDRTGLVAPKGIDLAEDEGFILVADFGAEPGSDNLKIFNTSDGGNVSPVGTTDLSVKPWDVAYDGESDRLFVALTDGTVAVFDRYLQQGDFGSDGPDAVLTPVDRRGDKISDNLHGIAYDALKDALVVTDVGDAAVADDGGIYVIHDAGKAGKRDGKVIPGRTIFGPDTLLGNPVDIILNGDEARVTEKAGDKLLVFDNIFYGKSGEVEPDLAVNETKPESIVAARDDYDAKPGQPNPPADGFDSDFDLNVYLSNNGPDNAGDVDTFDEAFNFKDTFVSGNNEGVDLDVLGNLYHAGDGDNGPSIRIVAQIRNRDDGGTYQDNVDREIKGDKTGLVAPKGFDIADKAGYLIVADFGADPNSGNLKVFGTAADGNVAPVATTSLNVKPWDVSYDEDGDRLFVALTDGTIAVFEKYLGRDDRNDNRGRGNDRSFGSDGPDRIITPVDDRGSKISTNIHGIFFVGDKGSLVVTDVGDATVNDDGSIYVFNDVNNGRGRSSSNLQPDRVIRGPATMLGNPVDVIVNGDEARVAEKARDLLLIFDDIFDGDSGNVAPDVMVDETKPESLVAEDADFQLTNPDVTDVDDADTMLDGIFATSNTPEAGSRGRSNRDDGNEFLVKLDTNLSSSIRAEFDTRDATANPENITFDLSGDAYVTFDNGMTPSQGGILVVNRLASSRDGDSYDPSRDRTIQGDQTGLVAPKGLDVVSAKGLAIVADFGDKNVKVFSTQTGGNVAPLYVTSDLGSDARSVWDLDYDPGNDRLFVAATDGTVLVYDDYTDGRGAGGPTRVITPTVNGSKASVNLHGVVHVSSAAGYSGDVLILSDVGDAASNADGQLFTLEDAGTASGNVAVRAQIGGPNSTLGNPVDITFDGDNLYVAEKTKDTVLRFDNILNQTGQKDVSPDKSVKVDNVESVALEPEYLTDFR